MGTGRHVRALLQEGFEVAGGNPPFLADLEAAQMALAQPLGDRALVHLQALGDLCRGQQLFLGHAKPSATKPASIVPENA